MNELLCRNDSEGIANRWPSAPCSLQAPSIVPVGCDKISFLFLECGGSTPLWMFGSVASAGTLLGIQQANHPKRCRATALQKNASEALRAFAIFELSDASREANH